MLSLLSNMSALACLAWFAYSAHGESRPLDSGDASCELNKRLKTERHSSVEGMRDV